MNWPTLSIREFCHTGSGGTPSRSMGSRYYGGKIPWVKSGELVEDVLTSTEECITEDALAETSAKLIEPGAVLVAMYGATVGRSAILGVPAATNQAVCHVVPDSAIASSRFVWFALRYKVPELLARRVGGAQPNISQQIIRTTEIPIPAVAEQHVIVEILDEADRLRRQRTYSDTAADLIVPTLFSRMFGDPVLNPKNWPVVPMSHFVDSLQGGKNLAPGPNDVTSTRFKILKVSAVTSTQYNASESKPLPPDFEPPDHYFVRRGDLLFSRANTTALVGACAYVFDTPPDRVLPDKIWRFVWREPRMVDPLFVWLLMKHPSIRRQLGKLATGTSGSMKNISMDKLLALRVPFPPLPLQQSFAAAVRLMRVVDEDRAKLRRGLEELWKTLLRRAFSGSLTCRWRQRHAEEVLADMAVQARHLSNTHGVDIVSK